MKLRNLSANEAILPIIVQTPNIDLMCTTLNLIITKIYRGRWIRASRGVTSRPNFRIFPRYKVQTLVV